MENYIHPSLFYIGFFAFVFVMLFGNWLCDRVHKRNKEKEIRSQKESYLEAAKTNHVIRFGDEFLLIPRTPKADRSNFFSFSIANETLPTPGTFIDRKTMEALEHPTK